MANPFMKPSGNSDGNSLSRKSKFGIVGPGAMLLDTYLNVKGGDDMGTAAFKAAGTGMLWAAAPWTMGATMLGSAAVQGIVGVNQYKKRAGEKHAMNYYQGTVGGQYMDTQRALTMRQAAVQQIQGNKLNARSALGGEAKILNQNFHRTV